MATMTDRRSVAENAKVNGVFSGQLHEYVSVPAMVNVHATASLIGLNLTVNIGGDIVLNDQEVNAQNRLPIRPDDLLVSHAAIPGDRVVIDWRNTTAGAITGFLLVDIVPV